MAAESAPIAIPEIVAVVLSVWFVSEISRDGESNWLEGVLLLMVYTMLGVLFFYLPPEARGPEGAAPAPAVQQVESDTGRAQSR